MNSFDVISVDYPVWFSLVVIATAIYPFVAPAMRRFRLDALALVLFPVAINLLVSLSGTAMLTGALSTIGHGHLAASAGGAEVQMPLVFGCASAALTSLLLALFERREALLSYVPSRLTLLVAAAVGVLITLNAVLIQWAARPGAIYSPVLALVAESTAWAAAAVSGLSGVAAARASGAQLVNGKRPKLLLVFAAVSAVVGGAIALLATQLLKIATSGAV